MVNYTCLNCGKEFNRKCNFIDHTEKKKNPCKPKVIVTETVLPQKTPASLDSNDENKSNNADKIQILNEEKENKVEVKEVNSCFYCGLNFSRKYHLTRHLDGRCKVKKLDHEEKETILEMLIKQDKENKETIKDNKEIIKQLQNKIDELQKDMFKYLTKAKTTNINKGHITNNTIIIPQNKLVNFGSEDVSQIPKESLLEILKLDAGYPAIVGTVKAIHYNEKYPQGMNAFISDRSRNKGMVYQNGSWKQTPSKKIFLTVMNNVDSYINNAKDNIENGIYNTQKDPEGKIILDRFERKLNRFYNRYLGDDDTVSNKVKKDFEKTVEENIIMELCNVKDNILENYNKLLADLKYNPNIKNKEETERKLIKERDQMVAKIDQMKAEYNNDTNKGDVIVDDNIILRNVTLENGMVVQEFIRRDQLKK